MITKKKHIEVTWWTYNLFNLSLYNLMAIF